MISRALFCSFILLNVTVSFSQTVEDKYHGDYHLIYLDISHNKDRESLTKSVLGLLDGLMQENSQFLVYCSNGYLPRIFNSEKGFNDKEKDNLISYLQISNPSPPIVRFDKDSILKIWDSNDIKVTGSDNRTLLKYNKLYLHYYVSSDIFGLEETELIDRLLLVKDLTRKHIDPRKIFIELFFRADDTDEFLERQNQLKVSNPAGYNYFFQSY